MKTAIVLTVKNEERLLLQNIQYHLGIGVERIFIYFDGTTDTGKDIVRNIDAVSCQDSVGPEKYNDKTFLKKFWSNAEHHHTARQCLNTYDALQKCSEMGIDWLISLDADELFLPNLKSNENVSTFFKTIPTNIDVLRLPALEVISRKMRYDHVMAEETLFKTKKNFSSKLDQLYQKIYNPYNNEYILSSYWLGHTMGKAAIKVGGGIIPHNVHRYRKLSGEKIKLLAKGNVLHYHIYDFTDFIKKFHNFKDHPATFLSGNKIEKLKSLWIKLVNDPSKNEEELKLYFKNNLLFGPKKIKRLRKTRFFNLIKRKEEAIIEITQPKEVLTNKGSL